MSLENKPIQAPKDVRLLKEPTVLRYSEGTRFLWGDEQSHQVADVIYGRGERISPVMYSLRSGEYFKNSATWRPHYHQDRFYFVVQGQLAIHDPESGEVAVADEGEAIYWSGEKYHFGYNFGQRETLVLDLFAPQERPIDVPEIEVSVTKPDLEKIVNGRYELLGKWPMERRVVEAAALRDGGMVTLRRSDALHMIQGDANPILVSILVSSEVITAGVIDLLPAHSSEPETHPGDEVIFALKGRLNVYLPDSFDWFEANPKDVIFLPEGTRHQYCNYSDEPLTLVFAVAPKYR